jgi:hypothetical protein
MGRKLDVQCVPGDTPIMEAATRRAGLTKRPAAIAALKNMISLLIVVPRIAALDAN